MAFLFLSCWAPPSCLTPSRCCNRLFQPLQRDFCSAASLQWQFFANWKRYFWNFNSVQLGFCRYLRFIQCCLLSRMLAACPLTCKCEKSISMTLLRSLRQGHQNLLAIFETFLKSLRVSIASVLLQYSCFAQLLSCCFSMTKYNSNPSASFMKLDKCLTLRRAQSSAICKVCKEAFFLSTYWQFSNTLNILPLPRHQAPRRLGFW